MNIAKKQSSVVQSNGSLLNLMKIPFFDIKKCFLSKYAKKFCMCEFSVLQRINICANNLFVAFYIEFLLQLICIGSMRTKTCKALLNTPQSKI